VKLLSLFIVFTLLGSCRISQKNRNQSEDYHKIAVSLINKCDNPRALSHLLKAVKLNSKSFLIRYTLATVYYIMGHYNKALVELQNILKQKPDFTEARVTMARVHISLNQLDSALKELKKAEKDITYTAYLKIISHKGLAYYKKENYLASRKWLKEALSLPHGKNCFTYLNLGRVEMALQNLKKSEQYLNKALSVCANEKLICAQASYEEQLAFAKLYIKKKDKRRAKYHFNIFLKRSPDKVKQELSKDIEQLRKFFN